MYDTGGESKKVNIILGSVQTTSDLKLTGACKYFPFVCPHETGKFVYNLAGAVLFNALFNMYKRSRDRKQVLFVGILIIFKLSQVQYDQPRAVI